MKDHILRSSVVWADGTHDSHKTCAECGLETCPYPVHTDYYRVLVSKEAKRFEETWDLNYDADLFNQRQNTRLND